jgi:hypothetical protein
MATYTFPTDLYIRTTFSEYMQRPAIRTRKELGYVKTRTQWTKTRKAFKFIVTLRDEDERETLRVFLENVSFGGNDFYFTHPVTDVVHTVVLIDDVIEQKYIGGGAWSARFRVEETVPTSVPVTTTTTV